MFLFIKPPRSEKGYKEYCALNVNYDILNPPWVWGWNKVINETDKYWLIVKSDKQYVFVNKSNHVAYCRFGTKITKYGRAREFSRSLPSENYGEYENVRTEVVHLNEQIEKLKKERREMIDYMKYRKL